MRPGLSGYATEPEWNRGVRRSARLNRQPVGDLEPELEEDAAFQPEDHLPLNQLFQLPEELQARLCRQEPDQRSASLHVPEPVIQHSASLHVPEPVIRLH